MGLRGAKAILVSRGDADLYQARLAGLEADPPGAVQRHSLPGVCVANGIGNAPHLHGQALNRTVALGANSRDHRLTGQGRRAGGCADEQLGGVGFRLGDHPQGEGFAGGVQAIVDPGGYDKVADLAWAWGPDELPGGRVVAGTFGQVAEAHRERPGLGRAVLVPSVDGRGGGAACSAGSQYNRQRDGLTHQRGVAADSQLRRAVDVKHAHLHGLLAAGLAVAGGKAQGKGQVLLVSVVHHVLRGCPFHIAGVGVKHQPGGSGVVVVERQAHGVVVGIARAHGKAQRFTFVDQLQRHRQDARGLVDVGYADDDVAREAGCAVAAGDGDAVLARHAGVAVNDLAGLRSKHARCPAQRGAVGVVGGAHVQHHACGHVADRPVQGIELQIFRKHVHAQRHAFAGADLVGGDARTGAFGRSATHGVDTQQGGAAVVCRMAHDDANGVAAGAGHDGRIGIDDVACAYGAQTAVGDLECDFADTDVGSGGRPADAGMAIEGRHVGADDGADGATGNGIT